ncbi:thioesterase [Caldibacillus lycopersici]|uniref:Thioesterase n=1 Tax=Perspicuibacillus lycopersici TaxID=1325689 RepID=A0AAE3LLJ6_9BACI|nr:acyl-ACP thioesterase domain-containing protein [Perspicuibacillus lycopersici]MCU9612011.1 thioesterase [Perspicuibacillus lycopersici]
MQPVSLFKQKYHIDLRDVDFNKHLKLSVLFSYFQDIASLASENLGYGINTLKEKHNVTWILMRIRVDIIKNPMWNEEIVIETWPLEPNRLNFERDYIVRDMDGNILIRAVSSWVVMDITERKLKRSDVIGISYPEIIKDRAIDCKLGKLMDNGKLEEVYQKVIGYSDIDFNGHINNSKYVDFIMDCFPVEDHKNHRVKSIEVNFINEALPGDIITLHRDLTAVAKHEIYIEGQKNDHLTTVFKAKVLIN